MTTQTIKAGDTIRCRPLTIHSWRIVTRKVIRVEDDGTVVIRFNGGEFRLRDSEIIKGGEQ
jgi:hypothetical protein